ncbi:hypothetical protein QQ008_12705 [Fulvivirgaceae bacterium BMA10]|uniref:Uncharacterized protein n=1 Tax=Splendidivirga corallicola TaxID=3051826 RepID=A0ABT8KNC7_9BACT|nr:hypothetical protein [Fulvivirgaceae bacterium BMA10]
MKYIYTSIALLLIVSCQKVQKDNTGDNELSILQKADIPYLKGESRKIFDAKPSEDFDNYQWFTNDHCFVTDHNGQLHWFGINNPYPPEGKELYRYHPYLGHLVSDAAEKNWKRLPFALDESKGTEYLGAPFVIWHEESERWVMVVETLLEGTRRLEVCWSQDLLDWERTNKAILPDKLWISSRDPHIMKGEDGKYWIHIVSTGNEGIKQSQVLRIRTKDFESFEDPETILGINDNNFATLIESPGLLERNGLWYLLFTYAHRRYTETIVVVSDDPNHFDYEKNTLTTLFGHAAKIFSYKGKSYISSCGPEDRHYFSHQSVSIAELGWLKQQ